jgi:hypothetical protein
MLLGNDEHVGGMILLKTIYIGINEKYTSVQIVHDEFVLGKCRALWHPYVGTPILSNRRHENREIAMQPIFQLTKC